MKIKNPKLTITTEDTLDGLPILLDNGYLVFAENLTGTFETVAIRDADYDVFYVDLNSIFVIEDTVNCTNQGSVVAITDPTKDASCTVIYDDGLDE